MSDVNVGSNDSIDTINEYNLICRFTEEKPRWPEWYKFNGGVQIVYPSYFFENMFLVVRCYSYNLFVSIDQSDHEDEYLQQLAQELCDCAYGHIGHFVYHGRFDYLLVEIEKLLLCKEIYMRNLLRRLDGAVFQCHELLSRYYGEHLFGIALDDLACSKNEKCNKENDSP